MINITVCGASGRMGTSIINLAKNDSLLKVTGAIEYKGSPLVGTGDPKISSDLASVIGQSDVVVDFTNPIAALQNLNICLEASKPVVIGVTGFDPDQLNKIQAAGKKIPVLLAPNMSVGVNVLFEITSKAAKLLADYDIEITEIHHNQKKDAPSGTAMQLAQIISTTLGRDLDSSGVYGRHGQVGARKKNEIGILSLRAGDVVGEHTVLFAGPGERLELTHRATSRDTLASGALIAAKWIVKQKPGFYGMKEVLGIG